MKKRTSKQPANGADKRERSFNDAMKAQLLLYTRKDCCLCEEMKSTLNGVAGRVPFALEEIDVDTSPFCRKSTAMTSWCCSSMVARRSSIG